MRLGAPSVADLTSLPSHEAYEYIHGLSHEPHKERDPDLDPAVIVCTASVAEFSGSIPNYF